MSAEAPELRADRAVVHPTRAADVRRGLLGGPRRLDPGRPRAGGAVRGVGPVASSLSSTTSAASSSRWLRRSRRPRLRVVEPGARPTGVLPAEPGRVCPGSRRSSSSHRLLRSDGRPRPRRVRAWASAPASSCSRLVYVVTRYALVALVLWVLRWTFAQLSNVTRLITRVLPLMLLFITFLFINTEVWQVAGTMSAQVLWGSLAVFAVIGVAVHRRAQPRGVRPDRGEHRSRPRRGGHGRHPAGRRRRRARRARPAGAAGGRGSGPTCCSSWSRHSSSR